MTHAHITCRHGMRWHLHCQACADTQHAARQHAKEKSERLTKANALLDAYRAGANFSARQVNAALAVTGDLCRTAAFAKPTQGVQAC